MLEILQDLFWILLTRRFEASNEQASGLQNLDVLGSEFDTGLTQAVHDLAADTFPVRVGAELQLVASAIKDSASFVWGYLCDDRFLHDNHKKRSLLN